MNKKTNILIIIMAFVVTAFVLFGIVSCLTNDTHGDGVTTCLNCGKKEVYAMNFCKRCYRSFYEYTWGND